MNTALELVRNGFYVYPLSPNSKAGVKGGHAFNDATNDSNQVQKLFQDHPFANIGILLQPSNLICVDVDWHDSNLTGKRSLERLHKQGLDITSDTYLERTPHGMHCFLKADTKQKSNKSAFFQNSGIEIRTNHITISPSEINGVPYEAINTWNDIKPAPQWVLDELEPTVASKQAFYGYPGVKKYTGKLIDEIVQGAGEGNRNDWLTKIIGRLFAVGAEPENIKDLVLVVNSNFVSPPLRENDVLTIFNSILRREVERVGYSVG